MRLLTALLILLLLPTVAEARIFRDNPNERFHREPVVSRGANRQYIGEFEATAYCLNKQPTKMGICPRKGVVAVDQTIIPLGTRLYIEGYGSAIACDIGPAIQGRELDLWISGYEACVIFGRRDVKVWRE